eukprot:jgi/Mesvir1/1576/Mv14546-RA.3
MAATFSAASIAPRRSPCFSATICRSSCRETPLVGAHKPQLAKVGSGSGGLKNILPRQALGLPRIGFSSHIMSKRPCNLVIRCEAGGSTAVSGKVSYPPGLYASAAWALMGSLQFGYHLGVVNTSLSHMGKYLAFDVASLGGLVVSAVIIGAILGSFLAGVLTKKFGTRGAIVANTVPYIVGPAIIAVASSFNAVIIGRFITGIAVGITSALVPVYISEIAPTSMRGMLGSYNQLFVCVGILISYLLGIPFEYNLAPAQANFWWRFMFAAGAIPAVLQIVAGGLAAGVPSELQRSGKNDEAVQTATKLWGSAAKDELAGRESGTMGDSEATWGEVFSSKYRNILILAAALPFLQQLSGINTVIFYSSFVFAKAGLASPIVGSIMIGVVNLAGTLLASALMDKAGRKALMNASNGGMALCLLALAGALVVPALQSLAGPISLVAIFLYVISFAIGAGPVPWLYIAEIVPPKLKVGGIESLPCGHCGILLSLCSPATSRAGSWASHRAGVF